MKTKMSSRTSGIVAFVTGAVALCFLVLPYVLFPHFYVPKANPTIGYTGPATVEGWAFMIIGMSLLIITIVLVKFRRNRY